MTNQLCYNKFTDSLFDLPQHGKVIAEYVWIGGSGIDIRSKARTLEKRPNSVAECPEWNYDGSSTYQAVTDNSEVILKPVAMFRDPFRRGDNIIVMCETFSWNDQSFKELVPTNTNFRHFANKIWEDPKVKSEETWYGIEQEYTFLSHSTKFTKQPLGWPNDGYPG